MQKDSEWVGPPKTHSSNSCKCRIFPWDTNYTYGWPGLLGEVEEVQVYIFLETLFESSAAETLHGYLGIFVCPFNKSMHESWV